MRTELVFGREAQGILRIALEQARERVRGDGQPRDVTIRAERGSASVQVQGQNEQPLTVEQVRLR